MFSPMHLPAGEKSHSQGKLRHWQNFIISSSHTAVVTWQKYALSLRIPNSISLLLWDCTLNTLGLLAGPKYLIHGVAKLFILFWKGIFYLSLCFWIYIPNWILFFKVPFLETRSLNFNWESRSYYFNGNTWHDGLWKINVIVLCTGLGKNKQ